jgi:hypothetical protein
MKETDIAYIAGLIDGEGYIGIKKDRGYQCQERKTPGYHARIAIHMVDEQAIKFIAETLGGWYYKEKPSTAQGRPLYKYSASDKRAEEILKIVLPFLRVKKASAQNLIDFRNLQSQGKQHRTKITGYRDFPNSHGTVRRIANKSFSDEYVQMCDTFYIRGKALNHAAS